ncbi:MAG: flagellar basal body rod protein FlgC [Campylobacterales bacterium]|nr:flagellar basal body rod protein FlgC [Campylobacterales bacterium]
MGLFDGYDVATSGMSAQRTRINIVSSNIANANTTRTDNGGPYKKQNVVFEEVLLEASKQTKKSNTENIDPLALRGVSVKEIIQAKDQPVMKYEPEHPDANEDGYVAYPNINPVIEMTDLIEAIRSYEANVAAFKGQKDLDTKTLDILKG